MKAEDWAGIIVLAATASVVLGLAVNIFVDHRDKLEERQKMAKEGAEKSLIPEAPNQIG